MEIDTQKKKSEVPKLLGQGTYGCVFEPNIPCDDGRVRKVGVGKVMKMQDAMEEAEITFEIMDILKKKVDKKYIHDYINPIIGECSVKSNDVAKECQLVNDNENNKYQLIYHHVGIDLNKYFSSKQLTLYENVEMMKMLEVMIRRLNTTFCLNKKCHLDVKPENILYIPGKSVNKRKLKDKLLPIDFGLVTDFENVYTFDNIGLLAYDYPYYPFEFKLYTKAIQIMYSIYDKKTSIDPLETLHGRLIRELVDGTNFNHFLESDQKLVHRVILEKSIGMRGNMNSIENSISMRLKTDVLNTINKFMNTLKTQRKTDPEVKNKKGVYDKFLIQMKNLNKEFFKHVHKIDVYSIGITMINILKKQGRENIIAQLKASLDDDLIKKAFMLKKIIDGCVTCNMYERYTFNKLIKAIKEFNTDIVISHPTETFQNADNLLMDKTVSKQRKCTGISIDDLMKIARKNGVKLIGYTDKDEICDELQSYLPKTYKKEMADELMGWPFQNKKIKVKSIPSFSRKTHVSKENKGLKNKMKRLLKKVKTIYNTNKNNTKKSK